MYNFAINYDPLVLKNCVLFEKISKKIRKNHDAEKRRISIFEKLLYLPKQLTFLSSVKSTLSFWKSNYKVSAHELKK